MMDFHAKSSINSYNAIPANPRNPKVLDTKVFFSVFKAEPRENPSLSVYLWPSKALPKTQIWFYNDHRNASLQKLELVNFLNTIIFDIYNLGN